MDTERHLQAEIAKDAEAAALFAWLAPDHRAAFVEFVRGEAPEGVQDRIAEAVAILAGRDRRLS